MGALDFSIIESEKDELSLRRFQSNDLAFIEELFDDADVERFYILLPEHQLNKVAYLQYLQGTKGVYRAVILQQKPIGIVCAEAGEVDGEDAWNVSYAILPQYRGHHYAAKAVLLMKDELKQYNAPNLYLAISQFNEYSENVAHQLRLNHSRAAFCDPNHMELGLNLKWIMPIHENVKRLQLCRKAYELGNRKRFIESIRLYEQALGEYCPPECPFTDAQIYCNIGMSYSWIEEYEEAYDYLLKAYKLGLRNPPLMQELAWLRQHNGSLDW